MTNLSMYGLMKACLLTGSFKLCLEVALRGTEIFYLPLELERAPNF
jgi:hypothetical protein